LLVTQGPVDAEDSPPSFANKGPFGEPTCTSTSDTFAFHVNLTTGLLAGTGLGSPENVVPGTRMTAADAGVSDVVAATFSTGGLELHPMPNKKTPLARHAPATHNLT